ncbi:hypothetical protein OSB04_010126 [Centaurea solstitialis]|uniref:Bacterial surface antigen (D15) domain-containing protein n=1 Tax=Centaurea solstitialis TaxID=347529 RepID=A0AA38WCJ0_9ASTR|nr:hypothetical protein OSB04_010126 [Centaurea solstitialis]
MPENHHNHLHFRSTSIKIPPFIPIRHHHHRRRPPPLFADLNLSISSILNNSNHPVTKFISFINKFPQFSQFPNLIRSREARNLPLLCSASLALTRGGDEEGGGGEVAAQASKGHSASRHDDERVLISEVLVRNKDGEELERKDLVEEAMAALKTCRPNSALTVQEVQEDVHRIIGTGYFFNCMPVAVDTRDGIRLVFQVEPNQDFQGLVCEGANVLPTKFVEDAFRDGYVVSKLPVYSMLQAKRDVDTLLAMGIMEDVSIVPQPAGDSGKVDLTINAVERVSGGISAGGGISSGITSGPLAGLIGSCALYHRNLFGRNQKNSRTPGTLVHGNQPNNTNLTIGRITAGIEYSRPFRPKWSGTAGLIFQRAGARDDKGNPIIRDFHSSPLTASGNIHDDMVLAKLESVYTGSSDPSSSMLVVNMEQGLPVWSDWLVFNRVTSRARKGLVLGPACLNLSLSGGHVVGNFPPHEAFPIGGTNSVRGYEEGAIGSGRSYAVGCGELSFPLVGP